MNVRDLVKELNKLDQELEVIISKDAEGNEYNKLDDDYGIGYYSEEERLFYDEDEIKEDVLPYEEVTLEEFIEETKSIKCITLFPIC